MHATQSLPCPQTDESQHLISGGLHQKVFRLESFFLVTAFNSSSLAEVDVELLRRRKKNFCKTDRGNEGACSSSNCESSEGKWTWRSLVGMYIEERFGRGRRLG